MTWTFISDEPTTSSFYLDDIFSDSTSITYSKRLADQHELLNSGSLTREDFQAVLWYPHYRFQELFNGHETSVLPSQRWHYTGNVLFLRTDRFEQLGLALNTAIRDSWLDLLANPRLISTLCMGMINCDRYIQSLYRTSGLFFYPELTSESLRAPLHARYQWLQ
jgi:hypothetical protein